MGGDFAQNAALVAVAIVTALIGVFKYLKTEASKEKPAQVDVGHVTAASFLDSRLVRELIDTIRLSGEEYAREARKMQRNRQDLISALEESADAMLTNTDALVNMHRFLRRQNAGAGDEPIREDK